MISSVKAKSWRQDKRNLKRREICISQIIGVWRVRHALKFGDII
jgi:hypothetical protein